MHMYAFECMIREYAISIRICKTRKVNYLRLLRVTASTFRQVIAFQRCEGRGEHVRAHMMYYVTATCAQLISWSVD